MNVCTSRSVHLGCDEVVDPRNEKTPAEARAVPVHYVHEVMGGYVGTSSDAHGTA